MYPLTGHDGREVWYLVRRGWVTAAVPAPHDDNSRHRAAEALDAVFGPAHPWTGATPAEEIDGVLLVAAWFRSHPEEHARTREPACLDVGRA